MDAWLGFVGWMDIGKPQATSKVFKKNSLFYVLEARWGYISDVIKTTVYLTDMGKLFKDE